MRMQIVMKPTDNLLGHMEVAFVAGLVDVPQGWTEALDDHVADLQATLSHEGAPATIAPVRLHHLSEAVPADVARELAFSDIDRFVTTRFSRTMPGDASNTQVLFRLTDLASSFEDGGVLAFAGTLAVDDVRKLDGDFVHELAAADSDVLASVGRVGRDLRRHFGASSMAGRLAGRPLRGAFDEAVWGFGHEPMALGTTAPLPYVRLCERYQDLFLGGDTTAEEKDELEELREIMARTGGLLLDREPGIAAALARFRRTEEYISPFAPRTRAQQSSLVAHFAASFDALSVEDVPAGSIGP